MGPGELEPQGRCRFYPSRHKWDAWLGPSTPSTPRSCRLPTTASPGPAAWAPPDLPPPCRLGLYLNVSSESLPCEVLGLQQPPPRGESDTGEHIWGKCALICNLLDSGGLITAWD